MFFVFMFFPLLGQNSSVALGRKGVLSHMVAGAAQAEVGGGGSLPHTPSAAAVSKQRKTPADTQGLPLPRDVVQDPTPMGWRCPYAGSVSPAH